jgi:hypothetical protein
MGPEHEGMSFSGRGPGGPVRMETKVSRAPSSHEGLRVCQNQIGNGNVRRKKKKEEKKENQNMMRVIELR